LLPGGMKRKEIKPFYPGKVPGIKELTKKTPHNR
jgi:hypothetical protein